MGQNGRWRRAMVDHIVPDRPGLVLDVASGPAGVALQLAERSPGPGGRGRPHARHAAPGTAQRGRAGHGRPGPAGGRPRAEQTPFADGTFDALTFTYLLRYVDDPQATLRRAGPGGEARGAVASLEFLLPQSRFWRFWWWLYTRLLLPAGGWLTGGREWFEVGRFLGPNISAHYRRYPVDWTVEAWQRGRLRRRRRAPDEPRRRTGDVGAARRWMRAAGTGRLADPRSGPPSTRLGPGGWRDWWTLLHPPYTAWHLAYVVIGACLAPAVNAHPADRHPAGVLPRRRPGRPRPRRAARASAAHPDPGAGPRRRGGGRDWPVRSPSGSPGSCRWAGRWSRSSSSDPSSSSGYNFELFGGVIHNDVGFAASWGAFPVLTAYVAQTGTLAARPDHAAAAGAFALSAGATGAEHAGPAAAPPGRRRRRGAIRCPTGSQPGRARRPAGPAGAGAPGDVVGVVMLAAALAVARLG